MDSDEGKPKEVSEASARKASKNNYLGKIFEKIQRRMVLDFEKAEEAVQHSGIQGKANEAIVKKFLRKYLPQNLAISTGEIIDSEGGHSRQMDIIIHDAAKTPIFWQDEDEDSRVIPIECVYAVIEVKKHLDGEKLKKAFENMKSLKALKKKAFFEAPDAHIIGRRFKLYGKDDGWEHWPVQHHIFAFDSMKLDRVGTKLNEFQAKEPVHQRIDSVFVLSKGCLLNVIPSPETSYKIGTTPTKNSEIVRLETDKSLLNFYILLSNNLNQAHMKNFQVSTYLGSLALGKLFHLEQSNPPTQPPPPPSPPPASH